MSRAIIVPESAYGVCVWQDTEGRLLSDGDGYLSLEGLIGDRRVEEKMAKAAKYWMGSEFCGKPKWISGARKISNDEYDDQNARLLEGKIPDQVEQVRQATMRGKHS